MRGVLVACAIAAGCGRLGFDVHSTTDATAATISDAGDAAGSACTPLAITDDFTAATASPDWSPYAESGVTVTRTGGQLLVTLPSNMNGAHYGGYVSVAGYDLREHCMWVTCVSPPSQGGGTEVELAAKSGSNNYTGFSLGNNHIEAFVSIAGTVTSLSQIPYDPSQPLTMRLRETAGMLYFEYSTDGVTFAQLISAADPVPLSAIATLFDAGTFAATASPGSALFDNFDVP